MTAAAALRDAAYAAYSPILLSSCSSAFSTTNTITEMATETNKQPSVYLTNIDEVKKVFSRFDTNGDGKISAEELVHVMKALGSNISSEEVQKMMTTIDTNCDGFINLEEFAGFCKGNAGEEEEEEEEDGGIKELEEAFELYDLNKNGLISSTELHQILTRLGENCTVDDCVMMIKSVDSDGDGFVNFEEFKKMMSNNSSNGDEQ